MTRLAFLLLLWLPMHGLCQQVNLLANPGFEDVNTCTEYHAQCAPAAWLIVSPPQYDAPDAKEGERMLPFVYDNVFAPMTKRTYPYTELLCTLRDGRPYQLSFWVYTGGLPFTQIDFLLSRPDPARNVRVIGRFSPSFSVTKDDVMEQDERGWMRVSHRFVAGGGERFFLLGNMQLSERYPQKLEKRDGNILFWLDDVELVSLDSVPQGCASMGYVQSILYQEHHRHTKHLYLDSLPVNSVPLQTARDTLVGQASSPPLFVAPPADTLLVPGVYFATNSAAIRPIYAAGLDSLIARIGARRPLRVLVEGHTDNVASDAINEGLSMRRAAGIRDLLARRLPGLGEVVRISGYGSRRPVVSNASARGRARNRRVEIIVIY